MSTENDVPLGEGSRQYYEQQFGDRIRQVKKGGGQPSGGSSGNWGKGGCGTVVLIFIGIRVISALFRSSGPSSQSYHYNPPSPPAIQFQQPMMKMEDLLPNQQDALIGADEGEVALLRQNDVPFLQGLCYRIYQESRQPNPTPGKHLLSLREAAMRDLVGKAAKTEDLDGIEQVLIIITLNEALNHPNFWDEASFRNVPGMKEYIQARNGRDFGGGMQPLEVRRRVLELCYPRQIIPLTERNRLDAGTRAEKRRLAKEDLAAARKQYEPGKR
jgi:hypothetical protein